MKEIRGYSHPRRCLEPSIISNPKGDWEGGEEALNLSPEGKGLYWEADAIAEDLRKGLKESAVIPLAESLRMMKLMDKIRADNGLVYPQD